MIRNSTNGKVICSNELIAETFWQRLTGMTIRKFSSELDGIVFFNCNAIHTFGMKFKLDVLFVDTVDMRIVSIHNNVKPWKSIMAGRKKCLTIELPAGTADENLCKTGDILEFRR